MSIVKFSVWTAKKSSVQWVSDKVTYWAEVKSEQLRSWVWAAKTQFSKPAACAHPVYCHRISGADACLYFTTGSSALTIFICYFGGIVEKLQTSDGISLQSSFRSFEVLCLLVFACVDHLRFDNLHSICVHLHYKWFIYIGNFCLARQRQFPHVL